MKKSEINSLDDKDLQLRYYLGGLKRIRDGENQSCSYWACDINCSCSEVPDDERLIEVKNFIKKHNITNERFIKLSYWHLAGAVMKYKGSCSPLFLELENALKPYNFTHTNRVEIPDNDFREKELETVVNNSAVKVYCAKYELDPTDFISLAKTSLNYQIYPLQVAKNPNDAFLNELYDIIDSYGLYISREQIQKYREAYKSKHEDAQLAIDTKAAQKRYLELMNELLIKQPDLATQMISEELNELGYNSRKDVKRLILQKR